MAKAGKRRGHKIRTIVLVLATVAAAGISGMLYMRKKVTQTLADDNESTAESESVTTGSLSTTVSGSGTLSAEGLTDVTIPEGVDVTRILFAQGTQVSEGDLLFCVDSPSVLSAMKKVQDSIDTLDSSLEAASADEVSESLTSGVSGRVKNILVEAGDDVSTVMYEKGALLTLSLDGYMAVDVVTDRLTAGDSVTVTDEEGTEYTGTVDSVTAEKTTILLTDYGPDDGETVTISFEAEVGTEAAEETATEAAAEDEQETASGDDGSSSQEETQAQTEVVTLTGELYIHSPLNITGYAGTVYCVNVWENESISADTSLLTLTDTSYSANYNTILAERSDLEEQLQTLIRLYQEGGVYAPVSGRVDSISESYTDYAENISTIDDTTDGSEAADSGQTDTQQSSSATSSDQEITVLTIDPYQEMTVDVSVDETDILLLEIGQSASITIDSIGEDAFEGSVTQISTSAESSSGVTTYIAQVTVVRNEKMLSGMSANVEITIDGVQDTLLVSSEAVHQTSSTSYVYTQYNAETGEFGGMTEVEVGLTDGSKTQILSGLKEGDTVWYEKAEEESSSGMPGMGGMNGGMGMGDENRPSGSGNSQGGPGSSGRSQSGGSGSSSGQGRSSGGQGSAPSGR